MIILLFRLSTALFVNCTLPLGPYALFVEPGMALVLNEAPDRPSMSLIQIRIPVCSLCWCSGGSVNLCFANYHVFLNPTSSPFRTFILGLDITIQKLTVKGITHMQTVELETKCFGFKQYSLMGFTQLVLPIISNHLLIFRVAERI